MAISFDNVDDGLNCLRFRRAAENAFDYTSTPNLRADDNIDEGEWYRVKYFWLYKINAWHCEIELFRSSIRISAFVVNA